jgi:hypothetical protein
MNRQCQSCDSTCEECTANDSNSCTKCELGKYLAVTDSTTLAGACNDKSEYGSSNDIYVYVSNADVDIAADESTHVGTEANPDIDLLRAISRAKSMVAPYTTKSDGSELVVHIILYAGEHYILKRNVLPIYENIDFYSASYHMMITPLYCDLFAVEDTDN